MFIGKNKFSFIQDCNYFFIDFLYEILSFKISLDFLSFNANFFWSTFYRKLKNTQQY